MADWRKMAISTLLADGKIDDDEVKALRKELWADGVIDHDEVRFLIELRNQAQKKAKAKKKEVNPKFTTMFFKAIEENVLKDGTIDASEAGWLREMLFADGKIDADEKKFLARIKKAAKSTSPAFNKLYDDCMSKGGKKKK
ncbi:MAG TPA: TerB family tellurite resistance protein [Gemmataceae bacterium]|nr:TerB family tellurite resistance protein [Gemmataceae bacterium]